MTQPEILTSSVQVAELARRLETQPVISMDLEADSLHSYRDKVCLIQISLPNETVLIDTLLVKQLDSLRYSMADRRIRKIFHAGDYDLRCLHRDFGLEVKGLFDTMISAQLLGEEKIGLSDLLQRHFQVSLDKRYQRADWSKRPLSKEMMNYAAEDTRHLHRLAESFEKRLMDIGRMAWAEEEFRLMENVRFENTRAEPLSRIKGAGKLDRRQLAILEELLQWRESEGRRLDRPVFKIASNNILLEVARLAPETERELAPVEAMSEKLKARYGQALVKAARRGLARQKNELPEFPKKIRKVVDPDHDQIMKVFKSWRHQKAMALQLDPGILINNSTLEKIVRGRPKTLADLKTLGELKTWQYEEFGKELLSLLASDLE
ncbi:MAG: HRDC domain-containing protein [Deltaproteobacteria bacterium]|jgi:ribonuclease D|nr:HRDC domain-containing protein [Deltaproteobacteria bacterium]